MKILFSGYHNPHFVTITEYIEEAIRNLGHELIVFDDRQHKIPGRIRCLNRGLHNLDLRHMNRLLLKLAMKTDPDVVIVAGGHRVMAKTVQCLKDHGIKVVLWTIDAPIDFSPIIEAAPYYDFIFCGGSEANEILNTHGVAGSKWLPFACDPTYHHVVDLSEEERTYYARDVAFVGSFYPHRWEILKQVTDFDMGIWGPGWSTTGIKFLDNTEIINALLNYSQWVRVYSAAKIVIVIHYQDEKKTLCYQASPKVFEALACHSFVLVDRQLDVFKLFKDGAHLVSFEEVKDLKKKIAFYLEHPDERKKISEQGYHEVRKKHTYIHRVGELIKVVGRR